MRSFYCYELYIIHNMDKFLNDFIQYIISKYYEIGKYYRTTKIIYDKALKLFELILKYINDENMRADINIYIAEIIYLSNKI